MTAPSKQIVAPLKEKKLSRDKRRAHLSADDSRWPMAQAGTSSQGAVLPPAATVSGTAAAAGS